MNFFEQVSDLEARRQRHLAVADSKRDEIAKLLGQIEDEDKAEKAEDEENKGSDWV